MPSRRRGRIALAALCLIVAAAGSAGAQGKKFSVSSPDLKPGQPIAPAQVFNGLGCTGKNVSPALQWANAPKGTKSFAVTAYDPDAPTGSGWWHWVMYDIPASATGLVAGAGDPTGGKAPAGAKEGHTDFGTTGYGGPCPPPGHGWHRYYFTVFALKVDRIDVPANATAAMIGFNLNANALAKAQVMGRYKR
jgi:Raf kinase inhibitor-like YbhB/YbcL family protein